jgi:hypothetical protein
MEAGICSAATSTCVVDSRPAEGEHAEREPRAKGGHVAARSIKTKLAVRMARSIGKWPNQIRVSTGYDEQVHVKAGIALQRSTKPRSNTSQ